MLDIDLGAVPWMIAFLSLLGCGYYKMKKDNAEIALSTTELTLRHLKEEVVELKRNRNQKLSYEDLITIEDAEEIEDLEDAEFELDYARDVVRVLELRVAALGGKPS